MRPADASSPLPITPASLTRSMVVVVVLTSRGSWRAGHRGVRRPLVLGTEHETVLAVDHQQTVELAFGGRRRHVARFQQRWTRSLGTLAPMVPATPISTAAASARSSVYSILVVVGPSSMTSDHLPPIGRAA